MYLRMFYFLFTQRSRFTKLYFHLKTFWMVLMIYIIRIEIFWHNRQNNSQFFKRINVVMKCFLNFKKSISSIRLTRREYWLIFLRCTLFWSIISKKFDTIPYLIHFEYLWIIQQKHKNDDLLMIPLISIFI
jgi:hypothetical protein